MTLTNPMRLRPGACWLVAAARALACAALVVLAGCAVNQTFHEGQAQLAVGQTEAGLAKLRLAMEQEPRNNEFRLAYYSQRERALNASLRDAELALELGDFDAARAAYAQAVRLDAANARAAAGAARIETVERHWKALDAAAAPAGQNDLDAAIARTRQVLAENPTHRRAGLLLRQLLRRQADTAGKEAGLHPRLKAAYRVPVSLSLSNATLLQVFEALKQASGLNYLLDRDVKPDLRVTLSVTRKPVEDLLRLLLVTNQLERRVLDEDTLLIYPATPAKLAEYREMVVRTFYVSNADAVKVANLVRTIAKARDVVVDEKLNLVTVRDSAEVIRLAEKLIAAQDLPEPEVMLDLEVLEVSVNRLLELGIRWPDSVSAGVVGSDGVAGQLRLNELRNRSADMVRLRISDPVLFAQLRSTKGDANLLANPRVRVRNKQSAKILIGERVPVITTILTANVGTSETVSYLDVGLKLEIEPTVSLDDDVSMKIALEVSTILETITRASGTQAYRLGTRNTSTSLRVHDGETNVLAGLIQRDERRSNTGVPGLNEVPVVNKLFGVSHDSDSRTEIVLLITPRIVRNLEVPGVGLQEFLSGTEASVGAAPIQLGAPLNSGLPANSPLSPSVAPAVLSPPANPTLRLPVFPAPAGAATNAPPAVPEPVPALTPPSLVPSTPGSR